LWYRAMGLIRSSLSCASHRYRQVCVCSVFVFVLAGCGSGDAPHAPHTQSLDGVAAMRMTNRLPGTVIEEGSLRGAFNGWLYFQINLHSQGISKWTIRSHSGEMTGSAETYKFHIGGSTAFFDSRGRVKTGTGIFAHVRPSVIRFHTFDSWLAGRIESTVTGRVSY
jgi:hypothetical protein